MNEILYRRELKRVMGYGIPKHSAQDIVEGVLEVVKKPENVEKFMNYAIDLKYGLDISHSRKAKNQY